jgi:hypothetical protein
MTRSTVCTLFEGHYHLGAAALINSIYASGFRGRVLCGYRGTPPPWAEPSRKESDGIQVRDFGNGFEVWLVPLATKIHFTNYKPTFMLEMWDGPAGNPEKFYYLDPDIVVKCPWEVMDRWAEGGLGFCEDVNYYLPSRHPLRIGWTQWLAARGVTLSGPARDRYYSGGFIGVPREFRSYLSTWAKVIELIGQDGGNLTSLKQGTATSLFHSTDQDAMNIALMIENMPVNATGPEGMDFAVGGHLLSHAIGGRKPWRGGFISQALQGYPPSAPAKAFFQYVDTPIQVFSASEKSRLKRQLSLGALIGRFYRRS